MYIIWYTKFECNKSQYFLSLENNMLFQNLILNTSTIYGKKLYFVHLWQLTKTDKGRYSVD